MKVRKHTTEQIITKLREVERLQSEGQSIAQACKQIAVSEHTYYKRRQRYGSMKVDEAKRLKDLERENQQLKKLVADLALDNQMLKEVARGNFSARRGDAGPSHIYKKSSPSQSVAPAVPSSKDGQRNATRRKSAASKHDSSSGCMS